MFFFLIVEGYLNRTAQLRPPPKKRNHQPPLSVTHSACPGFRLPAAYDLLSRWLPSQQVFLSTAFLVSESRAPGFLPTLPFRALLPPPRSPSSAPSPRTPPQGQSQHCGRFLRLTVQVANFTMDCISQSGCVSHRVSMCIRLMDWRGGVGSGE